MWGGEGGGAAFHVHIVMSLVAAGLAALPACQRSDASQQRAARDGRALFESACARCHGAEGTGGLPVSDGGPSPRNFRDRAFQASRSDDELKRTVVEGKGAAMPAFGRTFDEAQLAALVAHVRRFDPGAGAVTPAEGTLPR